VPQAIAIGVTVNPPNGAAVLPLTANDLQQKLALAQTQYNLAFTNLQTALAAIVVVMGGTTSVQAGPNPQILGTPAASPTPTQAQMQTLQTALNAFSTALAQLTLIVAQAQQSTPGINGVIIQVDTTAVPDIPTFNAALTQALTYAATIALLPI
jgi:hypothetical protein